MSVVIPSFNCAAYICTAIESVLGQTLHSVEIIVVDDGSTDSTSDVLQHYITTHHIRYIYQHNRGLPGARNTGLLASSAPYVAFLDADDTLAPEALELLSRALDDSKATWCVTDILKVRPNASMVQRSLIPPDQPLYAILRDDFIRRAMFFNREALIAVGMYDEEMKNREDWDINIRMIEAGEPFVYLPVPLYIYAWREDSITTTKPVKLLHFTEHLLRKHHKRLADTGDFAAAKIYAHNMWDLARQRFYRLRDLPGSARCIKESLAYDPNPFRLVHPLLHHLRRIAGISQPAT